MVRFGANDNGEAVAARDGAQGGGGSLASTGGAAATVSARSATDSRINAGTRNGRLKMILLLLFCGSPVIASYFTYYVLQPSGGQTNYGALIDPQRPVPGNLLVTDDDGRQQSFGEMLVGKWLLISVDEAAACDEPCAQKLFAMRSLRIAQGKHRTRIVPVWLVSDGAPVNPQIREAYGDAYSAVRFLRADGTALAAWLPVEPGRSPRDYIYLVDPVGHLMMRFPAQPDPKRMRKDLEKLLKWNPLGKVE